mmetsp:Transcript_2396/g.4243  ORF Transcript_2396/g.4243 Transcript_2396/m.4243 type:complete len:207 (-) Transcript_2396:713-1333(-)
MRSTHMSPRFSTGHATSSISIEVPVSRAAPTMGMSPLRTSQNTLYSLASSVKGYVSSGCGSNLRAPNGTPASFSALQTSSMLACRSSGDCPRHSTNSDAAVGSSSPSSPFTSFDRSSLISRHCRREAWSNISTASTAVSLRRIEAALQAMWMSGNMMKAEALLGHSGTVLMVARLTKPRVPSLPIISRFTISSGSSAGKSTSALRE